MADKNIKSTENPRENPQDKPKELKDSQKKPVDLPPQAEQLLAAELREDNETRSKTRTALETLSKNLPALPPSPERKLERFVA